MDQVKRALHSCVVDAGADPGVRDEARAALAALLAAEAAAAEQIAKVREALRPIESLRDVLRASVGKRDN